ncbi:sugar kinase [Rhodophyticola sp. CCM32]|uniref:sugar kinase n=1 Tax=Rhodophyticola sp. CCM32 TaxID=2916397 RepID=UPI00107EEC96|nr:sugar kinase [Rhodophyticola sp. CCM32]QBY01741.1 sugar kinase [Rhodophyticola sp. CCM32]
MTQRILSIGECMVELAATGPGTYSQGYAGDTFNTAWHMRRQLPPDWKVAYLTTLGTDPMSDRMQRFMAESGIATDAILRLPEATPGLYMIDTDAEGERSFSYWRESSAARHLADDADHLARAMAGADLIYVSGITFAILQKTARKTLLAALAQAKAAGQRVAFDSNIRPGLWETPDIMRDTLMEAAKTATIALPTWPDEAVLCDDPDPQAVTDRYRAAGVSEVVVKTGPGPALIASDAGQWQVAPEAPVSPVDTTGAGDSFNAAYLAARLTGTGEAEAARAAHDLAGKVIGRRGALCEV